MRRTVVKPESNGEQQPSLDELNAKDKAERQQAFVDEFNQLKAKYRVDVQPMLVFVGIHVQADLQVRAL